MKPGVFRYHRPATLNDALALLAEHGDAAKPIAGGQSLVPMMNLRVARPAELVDLGDLHDLAGIREVGSMLEIGALVRHQALADSPLVRQRCPLLGEAAGSIGHYAIRQRGTLGGSLAHADAAAQLPLVAVTLGAEIVVASRGGQRTVPATDFFVSAMTTALAPDELIVALRLPAAAEQEGQTYRMFNRRSGDYAIVSVAVTLQLQGGRVERMRLGVGAVEPAPLRLADLCAAQRGRRADAAWIAELAVAARTAVHAEDDERMPAVYRQELVETLVSRALTALMDRAGG